MQNITTNFALTSQLFAMGYRNMVLAIEGIFREVTGNKEIRISKVVAQDAAFDARDVGGETTVDFFQGDQLANGGSNMPVGYNRPESEHLLITSISGFDADSTAAEFGAIDWNRGFTLEELKNAYLSIETNGTRYLDKYPCIHFTQVAEQAESGVVQLGFPIPWEGNTDLAARLKANTAIAAANTAYCAFSLNGIGLI